MVTGSSALEHVPVAVGGDLSVAGVEHLLSLACVDAPGRERFPADDDPTRRVRAPQQPTELCQVRVAHAGGQTPQVLVGALQPGLADDVVVTERDHYRVAGP